MDYHKIHTRSFVSGRDLNYNMRESPDSHKGKETPKSTPSNQRKLNQTNNSIQKAIGPEASLFNHTPVIPCKNLSRQ